MLALPPPHSVSGFLVVVVPLPYGYRPAVVTLLNGGWWDGDRWYSCWGDFMKLTVFFFKRHSILLPDVKADDSYRAPLTTNNRGDVYIVAEGPADGNVVLARSGVMMMRRDVEAWPCGCHCGRYSGGLRPVFWWNGMVVGMENSEGARGRKEGRQCWAVFASTVTKRKQAGLLKIAMVTF